MKEYIAYEGEKFVIEWYFDARGKSQALDYYQGLFLQNRTKVLLLFKKMADFGEIKDKTQFNYEGDQIYAFKPNQERFFCFFYKDGKIIVTNAFRKKQQKLPLNEKERARKIKLDYLNRVNMGVYYD